MLLRQGGAHGLDQSRRGRSHHLGRANLPITRASAYLYPLGSDRNPRRMRSDKQMSDLSNSTKLRFFLDSANAKQWELWFTTGLFHGKSHTHACHPLACIQPFLATHSVLRHAVPCPVPCATPHHTNVTHYLLYPTGFTTNPQILEKDGVKCTLKSLSSLAKTVGSYIRVLVHACPGGGSTRVLHPSIHRPAS